jgi:hypothetical protein
MIVLAEEPYGWYLFDDMGQLFLDVLVEHGAISYSIAVELNEKESADYFRDGTAFLMQKANQMRHEAITKQWITRPLPSDWPQRSIKAVHAWQKKREEDSSATR